MGVPNTTTFSMQDVADFIDPPTSTPSLSQLITDANSENPSLWDPTYSGSKNSLLNFRNYGSYIPPPPTPIVGKIWGYNSGTTKSFTINQTTDDTILFFSAAFVGGSGAINESLSDSTGSTWTRRQAGYITFWYLEVTSATVNRTLTLSTARTNVVTGAFSLRDAELNATQPTGNFVYNTSYSQSVTATLGSSPTSMYSKVLNFGTSSTSFNVYIGSLTDSTGKTAAYTWNAPGLGTNISCKVSMTAINQLPVLTPQERTNTKYDPTNPGPTITIALQNVQPA
jgi:hypothetical protein